jgi:biotin carboxyl carrier protein
VDDAGVALGVGVVQRPGQHPRDDVEVAVRVLVEPGADVIAGQPLVVLEAMKMEHTVAATSAGTVAEVKVSAGQQVEAGAVLVVVEETTDAD